MEQRELQLSNLQQKLDILNLNYWEHFKFAKDLAQALGPTNPRYQHMEKSVNNILADISKVKKEIEKIKTP